MAKGTLYFTIGLPRSGKSTYANEWVKEKPMRVVVCGDDIRFALHGKRFEPLAESMVNAIKLTMIRALLNRGFDVLVDGTHTTRHSIKQLLEIDRYAIGLLDTNVPTAEECIQRAKDTGQEDLIPVIHRMNKNLEEMWEVGPNFFVQEILEEVENAN